MVFPQLQFKIVRSEIEMLAEAKLKGFLIMKSPIKHGLEFSTPSRILIILINWVLLFLLRNSANCGQTESIRRLWFCGWESVCEWKTHNFDERRRHDEELFTQPPKFDHPPAFWCCSLVRHCLFTENLFVWRGILPPPTLNTSSTKAHRVQVVDSSYYWF